MLSLISPSLCEWTSKKPTACSGTRARAPHANMTDTRQTRSYSRKNPPPKKACDICLGPLAGQDPHDTCVDCLGREHAVRASSLGSAFCDKCGTIPARYLRKRAKHFERVTTREETEAAAPLPATDSRPTPQVSHTPQTASTPAQQREAPRVEQPEEGAQAVSAAGPAPQTQNPQPTVEDWSDDVERQLPLQDDSFVFYEYDAIYDEEGYYEEDYDEEEEDEAGEYDTMEASTSRAPTTRSVPQPAFTSEGLKIDNAEPHVFFKKAAKRLGVPWPSTEVPTTGAQDVDVFVGLRGETRAPSTQEAPLMPATVKIVTESRQEPLTTPNTSYPFLGCAGMKELGVNALPPMERNVAKHLLAEPPSPTPDCWKNAKDKDFHKINKRTFNEQATALKCLNLVGLLAGSNTQLFREAGDRPTVEQMAEMRRANDEVLLLARTAIQAVGRSMSLLVVQERCRWLDKASIKDPQRRAALDQPLTTEGLLGTGTEYLKAEWKKDTEEEEALRACLPVKPATQPPQQLYRGGSFRPPAGVGGRPYMTRGRGRGRAAFMDPSGQGRGGGANKRFTTNPARGGHRGGRGFRGAKRPRQ